jgi:hypothetical protein
MEMRAANRMKVNRLVNFILKTSQAGLKDVGCNRDVGPQRDSGLTADYSTLGQYSQGLN